MDVRLCKLVNDVRQERRTLRAPALDSARHIFLVLTRAVRGSDYTPAIALFEEKDKLVAKI